MAMQVRSVAMYVNSIDAASMTASCAAVSLGDHENEPVYPVAPVELVEWEMSAGQVGALVGALCFVFALAWMCG